MFDNHVSNIGRATAGWGESMPDWVRQLAVACDRSSQRIVADRLKKSSGYVSRLINGNYTGSYEEAETMVRATFGSESVDCPEWGSIPLASCVRNRRQKGPPRNLVQRTCANACPSCPLNTDIEEA